MKNKLKKWLDKLASANKESFGNQRLDCCAVTKNINKPNTQRNRTSKTKTSK